MAGDDDERSREWSEDHGPTVEVAKVDDFVAALDGDTAPHDLPGYAAGHAVGHEEGFRRGRDAGFRDGYRQCRDEVGAVLADELRSGNKYATREALVAAVLARLAPV